MPLFFKFLDKAMLFNNLNKFDEDNMFCLSYINWSQYFLIALPGETFTAVLLPWKAFHSPEFNSF